MNGLHLVIIPRGSVNYCMKKVDPYKSHQRTKTTFGHIDSASITQVVQAFDVYPEPSVPRGWDIPLSVTSLFISARNIGLSPSISQATIRSDGPVGGVTRKLLSSGIMARRKPNAVTMKRAIKETKEQIHAYTGEFKKKFEDFLKEESDKVVGWLDWSMRRASDEHVQNFGSLIDNEFIPELSLLLDVKDSELNNLYKETSQRNVVAKLAKKESNSDFAEIVRRCFLVAVLLRGMYHDYVADTSQRQVAHHPLRKPFLPDLHTQPLLFDASMTEGYLSTIVLHDALCEKKLEYRLGRWVENIEKIRKANMRGNEKIDLRPTEDPNLALKRALRAAEDLRIHVIPRRLENFLPKVFGVVVGKGVELMLTPFIGTSATIFGEPVEAFAEDLSRKGLRKLYGHHGRLAKLAKSPPGRLSIYKRIFPI